jgi:hypothetical protein
MSVDSSVDLTFVLAGESDDAFFIKFIADDIVAHEFLQMVVDLRMALLKVRVCVWRPGDKGLHPVTWRHTEPLHLGAQAFKGPRNVDFNIKAMHDTVSYVAPPASPNTY